MVVFRDDFSSDSLEQWQVARGAATQWKIQDGVLIGLVSSQSSISELIPTETAWSQRWGNYRFTVSMKPMRGVDRNLAWNYQDPRNWYEAHFVGNLVELYRLRDGVTGYVSSHQYFLTPFEWHQVQVEVVGQQMRLWIDGWLVADVHDWFDDGRAGSIALKVGTGAVAPSEVWFDNVRVELLPTERDAQLDLTRFRQDDQIWAADEYDHAVMWSAQTSIERWGCALSSIAMVLRYYGFAFLPNGDELNPGTLNQWLRSQPDGYIADGWVNWVAIERLSRWLVRDYMPGFQPIRVQQFTQVDWHQLVPVIIQELSQSRPVIVALAQHFMVATGTISDQQDIRVLDPWYASETVGQHELAGRTIKSLRLIERYQLSEESGLSGWLFAIKNGGQPHLHDADGQDVAVEWRQWLGPERGEAVGQDSEDGLAMGGRGDAIPDEWQVWQVAQPPSGTYFLSLPAVDQSTEVWWYAYGLGDTVEMKQFSAAMLVSSIRVQVDDNLGTSWPEYRAKVWGSILKWWEQQESVVRSDELEGWLRVRYLLRLIVNQAVFDERQEQLVLKTIEYYRTNTQTSLWLDLEKKFSDLVRGQTKM